MFETAFRTCPNIMHRLAESAWKKSSGVCRIHKFPVLNQQNSTEQPETVETCVTKRVVLLTDAGTKVTKKIPKTAP
jgi:hypothetical protein